MQDLTNAELTLVLATLKEPNARRHGSLVVRIEEALDLRPPRARDELPEQPRGCLVANALLKVKNARFGAIDRESTALVRAASSQQGHVVGLLKKDSVLRDLNQRTRGSAKVAVIVLSEEQKAEARQRFATPLIFSVHEAKGLEYEAVILYDLVSTERARFREIADGVLVSSPPTSIATS